MMDDIIVTNSYSLSYRKLITH